MLDNVRQVNKKFEVYYRDCINMNRDKITRVLLMLGTTSNGYVNTVETNEDTLGNEETVLISEVCPDFRES